MMDISGNLKAVFHPIKSPLLAVSAVCLGIMHPAHAQYTSDASSSPPQHRLHHVTKTQNASQAMENTELTAPEPAPDAALPPYTTAVSGINGWLSGSGGGWHNHYHNGYSLVASGGVDLPLTHWFGVQIDGYDGVLEHDNLFVADGYLFWRKPEMGALGGHYRYANIDGVYANLYGVHAEGYMNTISAIFEGGGIHTNKRGGQGYGEAILAWYPQPDWRLDVGYWDIAGNSGGQAGTEYLFHWTALPGLSAYAAVGGGNYNLYYGYVGLRVYFNCDKPLINRHREDMMDASYDLVEVKAIEHLRWA